MIIDISKPVTIYEVLTLLVSLVVLVKPCLIFIYKRLNTELAYYPNGELKLFFNKSGAYVQIFGSCKALNSDIVVRKIEATVKRQKDNKELNLVWSSFIAPFVQQMGSDFVSGNEQVHPFQITENSMVPIFVEFEVKNRTSSKEINLYMNQVEKYAYELNENNDFNKIWELYQKETSYVETVKCLEKEFYWETGRYSVDMIIHYNDNSKTEYSVEFDIPEEKSLKLRMNIQEVIMFPFKQKFRKRIYFYTYEVSQ